MTEQSNNDQFHASSFMQGHNAEYLEQLYAQYATDPGAVKDFEAFCKQTGNELVSHTENSGEFVFFIRKH